MSAKNLVSAILMMVLVGLAAGCAVPHPALERPPSPGDANPQDLLPPGQVTPFAGLNSTAGQMIRFPDGSRMGPCVIQVKTRPRLPLRFSASRWKAAKI